MQEDRLRVLLSRVASGELSSDQALEDLRKLPFENIGFARIDQHRHLRQGLPEVIFCPGKTADQIMEIAAKLKDNHDLVLASRVSAQQADEIGRRDEEVQYFKEAGTLVWGKIKELDQTDPEVAIVTAGTADLPVAMEAQLILQCCGIACKLTADIGVAGLHRLIDSLPELQKAQVCIVVAGMDGALPSVVGGLLSCPVIACPTSVGYGSCFEGLSALLTMLNSCASGITVVNIDNGFGAAVAAFRILKKAGDGSPR